MKESALVAIMAFVIFAVAVLGLFIVTTLVFGSVPPWFLLTLVAGAEIWCAFFSALQMAEPSAPGCMVLLALLIAATIIGWFVMTVLGVLGQYVQFAFLVSLPIATVAFVQVKPFVDAQRVLQKGGGSDYS